MKGTRAAYRYAKAILEYAESEKATATVAHDMKTIIAFFVGENVLGDALENPILSTSDKQAALNAIFSDIAPATKRLLDLLAENNRLNLLGETARQFLSLYDQHQGIVKAVVTSAVPLTPELEKIVLDKAKQISDKTIVLENRIAPEILGGFILRIGDLQYDASVVQQLKAIKTTLTTTNSI